MMSVPTSKLIYRFILAIDGDSTTGGGITFIEPITASFGNF